MTFVLDCMFAPKSTFLGRFSSYHHYCSKTNFLGNLIAFWSSSIPSRYMGFLEWMKKLDHIKMKELTCSLFSLIMAWASHQKHNVCLYYESECCSWATYYHYYY